MAWQAAHPVSEFGVDALNFGSGRADGRLNVAPELLNGWKLVIAGGLELEAAGGGVQLAERPAPGLVDGQIEQVLLQVNPGRLDLSGGVITIRQRFDVDAVD